MSFKEETEFNMLPAKGNGSKLLQNHITKTKSGIDVLKTAAIYGANAAGKSNLINAIDYFKSIVFNEESLLVPQSKKFRVDSSYKSKPTTFRMEYEYMGIHFDYAIEIFKGKIKEEWLYQIESVKKGKEKLLYKRIDNEVEFGDTFKNSKDLSYIQKYLKKELKDTESVLDACFGVIDDIDILDTVYIGLSKLTIVTPFSRSYHYSESILTGNKSTKFAKDLLINSKTGIEDLIIKEIDADVFFSYSDEDFKKEMIDDLETSLDNRKDKTTNVVLTFPFNSQVNVLKKIGEKYFVSILKTKHFNSPDLFDFDEESDGTNRLFELSPAFEQLIHEGNVVYIIDELERSMHPLLAKELLKMYSLNSTSKSQLIFTTHESHLLDNNLLRRDEIWFTEKKSDGSTEFYPLSNFNPRGDKVLERGYLEGRYGGIPFLGDFSKLIVEENQI
ncbi:AAA family ATPase [Flavobacterium soyangense]|uniref:ATP-binding protein n=1 Tax=Flavobacterium soyangense TaxID=2023265 RepID=A0A930XT70_9FLAO|nr:ATP-binding protein [Flavobacterium soyangense]MBF2707160.1 ATP-binding protein [Flavobacterium soyangense]